MTGRGLDPHGPPARTSKAGTLLDEVTRFLAYATLAGSGGLAYPGDVYALTADLYTAAGRLPQVCDQLEQFLAAQLAGGGLYEARGGDPAGACGQAAACLRQAAAHAAGLTRALQDAQCAISGLGVRDNGDG